MLDGVRHCQLEKCRSSILVYFGHLLELRFQVRYLCLGGFVLVGKILKDIGKWSDVSCGDSHCGRGIGFVIGCFGGPIMRSICPPLLCVGGDCRLYIWYP